VGEPRHNCRLPLLDDWGPTYAVWEVTLRCNQACRFCGTRAGHAAPDELSTDDARELIRQLSELGVREVSMHGGEAYLRTDFFELVRCIRAYGMAATLVTGGRGLTREMAQKMKDADISAVSVSLDGPRELHDDLRGFVGSFDGGLAALYHLEAVGIDVGANTQVNRANLTALHELYDSLRLHPLYGWQVQLMVPMGRAADEPGLWLEPYDMLELFPILGELKRRCDEDSLVLWPGDNIGYFGPFEDTLRGERVPGGWSARCGGGVLAIGIEANGDIKGCSAMASEGFVAGNVKHDSLRKLWDDTGELKLSRCFDSGRLWGFCATCYYASECHAGCIWTANTILGRYGNNPYCHHRALERLARGERERLVRVRKAPGKNRDCAVFELVTEPAPSAWAAQMRERNRVPPLAQQPCTPAYT
jgi:radical SAM protein with 4Fe4S-binding SPASM domain